MGQLDGKVAIITGGGGGIGTATAQVMSERGAKLVLADLALADAERTADEITRKGGTAFPIQLDLAEESSIKAMIDFTIEKFGKIDVLHNNAAHTSRPGGPRDLDIELMDVDLWDRAFRVNTRGTMLCCKYTLPHMVRQGSGSIINTASNLGMQGNVIQVAYSSSKAAILQMTRAIAASHGRRGIRCNAVSPGLTLTPHVVSHLSDAHRQAVLDETLTPYLGDPNDIAYAVAFLASDEARYVTGHNLVADGGTAVHVPGFAELSRLKGNR